VSSHVTGQLSEYIDGSLGVIDLEHVEAHLGACPSCQGEYQEHLALRRMLRRLPEPSMPRGFQERVHWQLQREAAGQKRGAPVVRWPSRVRSLVLACAATLLVLALPLGWTRFAAHKAPLDTNAYIRDYLMYSTDRLLTDQVATSLVTSDDLTPQSPSK